MFEKYEEKEGLIHTKTSDMPENWFMPRISYKTVT
jgi:hypothetical protein